ncbi:UDP-N-acetylmuramoyl-L-alanyl-D-glutamate--2,6-diaminopimelate ligase [Calditrichota bacterium LG25]
MNTKREITLKKLLSGMSVDLPDEMARLQVSGVQYDSRKVHAGNLFVAIRGFQTDGHQFLKMAAEKGACCALVEEKVSGVDIPQLEVNNTRELLPLVAANFYRPEIDRLTLIGITGTNGKTTTSYLVQSILNEAGKPAGVIGTIQYLIGGQKIDAWNTTPESVDICRMLYELAQQNFEACVLEVSSHALALNRVDGLKFKAGVFTNLSRDHLDFHKTMENYFEAKMRLFTLLHPRGTAVINFDDPYVKKAIDRIEQAVITFGYDRRSDVYVLAERLDINGIYLKLQTPFGPLEIHSRLRGHFNVQNIMAAVGSGLALGLNLDAIKRGIEKLDRVPGRLEPYEVKPGVLAVIDYAHTPDSLEKALQSLRPLTSGRLIVVFGAGGDRDRGKRPLMGTAAEKQADVVIVTSDNPRTEDPQKIIDDILTGIEKKEKCQVIVDRKKAIFQAVHQAQAGDVILIAGKGHEMYQDVNGVKHPFDEVAILKEASDGE